MIDYKKYCIKAYQVIFKREYRNCILSKAKDKRRHAQRAAIRRASVATMKKFPDIEPTDIWKTIYIAHVNNVSGIADQDVIKSVISADNSWKKSSGHAFEEMIAELANLGLAEHGLKIILQKELSNELKLKRIKNEVRDISWLKEQVSSSIFDLYLAIEVEDGLLIYGCVQSKTSIRDRVTRDREPSINAMSAFFISIAIVMDGDFLRLQKFTNMVNGNSAEFDVNGWHSMYVLSNDKSYNNDRIKCIDLDMGLLISELKAGADYWTTQRQWLNPTWRAEQA
ncbi:BsaWI family type II restriction enzyme [Psychromonas aquimarina]|uniref:BsaWI family type II restriction enzyme n=1 Tax=Psychromonas aquimarina TaxID=444919 RepID=UPI0004113DE4|nr:BsaWI family type II restriction enzyme [Psychromonas aquimarina]